MLFDFVGTFARVIKANIKGTAHAVLANLTGIAESLDETSGEKATDQPLYGPIGFISVPKAAVSASAARGSDPAGYAEVVALKSADGLIPVAGRDLRLNRLISLTEGIVAMVQYGGGLFSITDRVDGGAGSTAVLYTPQKNSSGDTLRAHAIALDTTSSNLSVSIVHANGHAVLLTQQNKVVIKNAAGDVYVEVSAGGVVINGNTQLVGGLVVSPGIPNPQPVALAPPLVTFVGALTTLANAVGSFATATQAFGQAIAVIEPLFLPAANTLTGAATTLGTAITTFGTAAGVVNGTFPTGMVATKTNTQ